MQTRRFLVLTPLVLLGCSVQNNWFLPPFERDGTAGDSEATSTTVTTGESSSTVHTATDPSTCGDGIVDGSEVCDEADENTQAMYAQEKTCLQDCLAYTDYCGDGVKNGPEVCDEGENNSDAYSEAKHCNQDCSGYAAHCGDDTCQAQETCPADCMSVCGDGDLQAGEQCDEMGNTADCDADCTKPECGDEFVNPSFMDEQCDDKNMDNSDDCVEGCQNAVCGDGFLQNIVEQCDDKNQVDTDACSNTCVLPRRVFVTAGKFDPEQIQGVVGADGICQAAAMKIPGLGAPGNTWLAWLSDDKSSPSTRVPPANTSFDGYYLLPTGVPVAQGWTGLKSGTLMNPINVTEAGVMAGNPLAAWTNTLVDGTSGGANDCEDWSQATFGTQGGVGSIVVTSEQWTVKAIPVDCTADLRLYCIEVSP